jgi:hypothetical protein
VYLRYGPYHVNEIPRNVYLRYRPLSCPWDTKECILHSLVSHWHDMVHISNIHSLVSHWHDIVHISDIHSLVSHWDMDHYHVNEIPRNVYLRYGPYHVNEIPRNVYLRYGPYHVNEKVVSSTPCLSRIQTNNVSLVKGIAILTC